MSEKPREGTPREKAWLRSVIRHATLDDSACFYELFGALAEEAGLPEEEADQLFDLLYRRTSR